MIENVVDSSKYFLHIIYDTKFFNWGLVFSAKGKFLYALPRESVEEIKSYSQNGITSKMDCQYHIVDPADRSTLVNFSSKISIDNFNIYFRKTFHEYSPWIDSASFFQSNIIKYVDLEIVDGRVLDLGSGGGQYLKNSNYLITRLDLFQIDKHSNSASKESKENYVVGNALSIPVGTDSFDLILCNFLLEHVSDIREVAKEINRVLKHGGKAIISFPSLDVFETLKVYFLGKRISLPLNHLRAFGIFGKTLCESIPRFVGYLKSLNLSVAAVEGIGCVPFTGKVIQRINNKLGNSFLFKYLGAQTIVVVKKNTNNSAK